MSSWKKISYTHIFQNYLQNLQASSHFFKNEKKIKHSKAWPFAQAPQNSTTNVHKTYSTNTNSLIFFKFGLLIDSKFNLHTKLHSSTFFSYISLALHLLILFTLAQFTCEWSSLKNYFYEYFLQRPFSKTLYVFFLQFIFQFKKTKKVFIPLFQKYYTVDAA